jgi:hypothetical protein
VWGVWGGGGSCVVCVCVCLGGGQWCAWHPYMWGTVYGRGGKRVWCVFRGWGANVCLAFIHVGLLCMAGWKACVVCVSGGGGGGKCVPGMQTRGVLCMADADAMSSLMQVE